MQFTRGNSAGYLARTGLSITGTGGLLVSFRLNTTNSASVSNVATWYFGNGFTTNNANVPAAASTFTSLAIDFQNSNTYRLRSSSGGTSTVFSGWQTITWVINNTASSINYTGFDCGNYTLASGQVEVYVGTTKVFSNVAAVTAGAAISDFKFIQSTGTGSVQIDDLVVQDLNRPWASALADNVVEINAGGTLTAAGIALGATRAFSSLTNNCGLFQYINNNGISTNVTAYITSDLTAETATFSLNQWSGSNTLTIRQDGNNVRTVSGSASNGLIVFNGADNVSINGSCGSCTDQRGLVFRNTATSGDNAAVLRLNNGVNTATIENCKLEGNFGISTGLVEIGGTGIAQNITLDSCTISNRQDIAPGTLPTLALRSVGASTSARNTNITISNCLIFNVQQLKSGNNRVVYVRNNTWNFTFDKNHIYQTIAYNQMSGGAWYSVLVQVDNSDNNNINITNNFFGGTAPSCGGTAFTYNNTQVNNPLQPRLITVSVGTNTATIKGNTISNIRLNLNKENNSNAYGLIAMNVSGNVLVEDNTIGSLTTPSAIVLSQARTVSVETLNVQLLNYTGSGQVINNKFGGVVCEFTATGSVSALGYEVTAMNITNSANGVLFSHNQIGSQSAPIVVDDVNGAEAVPSRMRGIVNNSNATNQPTFEGNIISYLINKSTSNISLLYGILQNGTANVHYTNNHIRHLTGYGQVSTAEPLSAYTVAGMLFNTTARLTLSGNHIYNLKAAATAGPTNCVGMVFTGGVLGSVYNNRIYALDNTLAGSNVTGIMLRGIEADFTVYNNMISLGLLEDGSPSTHDVAYIGIWNNQHVRRCNTITYTFNTTPSGSVVSQFIVNGRNVLTANSPGLNTSAAIASFLTAQFANPPSITAPTATSIQVSNALEIFGTLTISGLTITRTNASCSPHPHQAKVFYNSVYIGGISADQNSYAYLRGAVPSSSITSGDTIRVNTWLNNNLLYNHRTGAGAGKNYVIGNKADEIGWNLSFNPCISINKVDFNAYYANNSNNFLGLWNGTDLNTFTDWQKDVAAGGSGADDSTQVLTTPITTFVSPQTADLHIGNTELRLNSRGVPLFAPHVPISLNLDIDNELRRGPDIGADEITVAFTSTGTTNDWHLASTWDKNAVPSHSDSVIVAHPVFIANAKIGHFYHLTVKPSNGTLTLQGTASVYGCWYDGALLNEREIVFAGDGSVYLAGSFIDNASYTTPSGTTYLNMDEPAGLNCLLSAYIKDQNNKTNNTSNIGGSANTTFHHLTILNAGGTALEQGQSNIMGGGRSITINGVLDIQGLAAWLGLGNNNTLTLNGTLSASGQGRLSGSNTAHLIINGSGGLGNTLRFRTGNEQLANLTLNRAGSISLGTKLDVYTNAQFTNGLLNTSAINILSVMDNATANGGNANSYVQGPMRKVGDEAFVFPIGKGGRWARAAISDLANTDSNDAFIAEYFYKINPQIVYNNTLVAPLDHISALEYWTIDRTGSTQAKVSLYWENGALSGINKPTTTDLRVAHFQSDNRWYDEGNIVVGSATTGYITSNLLNNFSPFTLASVDGLGNALPSQITDLQANTLPNQQVRVQWASLAEQNLAYYEVERAGDAHSFAAIGRLTAKGNNQTKTEYEFLDRQPLNGRNYYRLRITDRDASTRYSEVVSAEVNLAEIRARIYPNPAQESLVFNLAEQTHISFMDMQGNVLYRLQMGAGIATVPLPELPKGIYIVEGRTPHEVWREKLVKE